MKKRFLIVAIMLFAGSMLFAQNHSIVPLHDDVYDLLSTSETYGLCSTLRNERPYTKSYIITKLNEVAENLEKKETKTAATELKIVKKYIERFTTVETNKWALQFVTKNNKDNFPITFGINGTAEAFVSGGIYDNSDRNSVGFEEWQTLGFFGDLGKYVSYTWNGGIEMTQMPLQKLTDKYLIGSWWNETDGYIKEPENPGDPDFRRYISVYQNNSVLPYHYVKNWDGSIYHLENFSASGLKSWPTELSFGLTMQGSVNAAFLNDRLNIAIARNDREWGAMDNGASLALNASARPFVGMEIQFDVLDWFSFAGLTGFLEFPNQAHINQGSDRNNAWDIIDENGNKVQIEPYVKDSFFYQSMFTINSMNFDFEYFHADFGSVVIFPKRFELGYLIPMFEKVIYQNNVGDFDNLGLFGSLRAQVPGLGYAWFSGYAEEINVPNIKTMYKDTRCMYAWQLGIKSIFPLVPFGNISFRYTKIEPFCYTHAAVKTPYSSQYVSTAYVNNGAPLGYYLDPNSDEFLFRFETRPTENLNVGAQYQLIRHGTTWGPGQVEGSSIYSELPTSGRNSHKKYFLKDGVYQWTSMVILDSAYDFRGHGLPFSLSLSAGYIFDWFTKSGSYNDPSNMTLIKKGDPLYDFYPTSNGLVLSLGVKVFSF